MSIKDKIVSLPWGLNIIVVIFGIEMIRNVVELLQAPKSYKFLNTIIAVVFFLGFLFRWETVRFVWRLLSCFFIFVIFYDVLPGEQFDFKQKALSTVSLCLSGVMFYYLGRPPIRALFK